MVMFLSTFLNEHKMFWYLIKILTGASGDLEMRSRSKKQTSEIRLLVINSSINVVFLIFDGWQLEDEVGFVY